MATRNYKVSVSYESDLAPIVSMDKFITATSAKSASVKAARACNTEWPKGRKFRSWVIVIQQLGATDDTATV